MAEVAALARDAERVRLLWDVCQIPDFRQLPFDDHFQLQAGVYKQLCGAAGRVSREFIQARLSRLQRMEGDLETLLDRMSAVRTWTYITAHPAWVDDAAGWQAQTHELEDRLSDALHHQLVQRFVDVPAKRGGRRATRARPATSALARGTARGQGARPRPGERQRKRRCERRLAGRPDRSGARAVLGRRAGPHLRGRAGSGAAGARVGLAAPEITFSIDLPGGGVRLQLGRRLLAFGAIWWRPCWRRCTRFLCHAGARGTRLAVSAGTEPGQCLRGGGRPRAARGAGSGRRRVLLSHKIVLGHQAVFLPALLAPVSLARPARAMCSRAVADRHAARSRVAGGAVMELFDDVPDRIYEALGYVPVSDFIAVRADELEAIAHDIVAALQSRRIAARLALDLARAGALVSGLRSGSARSVEALERG